MDGYYELRNDDQSSVEAVFGPPGAPVTGIEDATNLFEDGVLIAFFAAVVWPVAVLPDGVLQSSRPANASSDVAAAAAADDDDDVDAINDGRPFFIPLPLPVVAPERTLVAALLLVPSSDGGAKRDGLARTVGVDDDGVDVDDAFFGFVLAPQLSQSPNSSIDASLLAAATKDVRPPLIDVLVVVVVGVEDRGFDVVRLARSKGSSPLIGADVVVAFGLVLMLHESQSPVLLPSSLPLSLSLSSIVLATNDDRLPPLPPVVGVDVDDVRDDADDNDGESFQESISTGADDGDTIDFFDADFLASDDGDGDALADFFGGFVLRAAMAAGWSSLLISAKKSSSSFCHPFPLLFDDEPLFVSSLSSHDDDTAPVAFLFVDPVALDPLVGAVDGMNGPRTSPFMRLGVAFAAAAAPLVVTAVALLLVLAVPGVPLDCSSPSIRDFIAVNAHDPTIDAAPANCVPTTLPTPSPVPLDRAPLLPFAVPPPLLPMALATPPAAAAVAAEGEVISPVMGVSGISTEYLVNRVIIALINLKHASRTSRTGSTANGATAGSIR
jgi:hypothetical protein